MRRARARLVRIMFCLGVAALALVSSGCAALVLGAAAAGGAAGYAYYRGSVARDLNADFGQAWVASQWALHDLGLPVTRIERGVERGSLDTVTPDQDRVHISLAPSPTRPRNAADLPAVALTRVHVRVGTFGDHPLSQRILDQIEVRLAQGPAAAPAPPVAPAAAVVPPVVVPAPAPRETAPPPLATPPGAPQ